MLNSLDEDDKVLTEDSGDSSEESKEKMTNDINNMRTIINDAMARLETK